MWTSGSYIAAQCFKCSVCNKVINTVSSAGGMDGNIFHKDCFKKQFRESGGKYGGKKVVAGERSGKEAKVSTRLHSCTSYESIFCARRTLSQIPKARALCPPKKSRLQSKVKNLPLTRNPSARPQQTRSLFHKLTPSSTV